MPEMNMIRTALQKKAGRAIIPFRRKVVSMAKTVVEILAAMHKGTDTKDLHEELKKEVADIKKHLEDQKWLLESFSEEYRDKMSQHLAAKDSSFSRNSLLNYVALATAVVGVMRCSVKASIPTIGLACFLRSLALGSSGKGSQQELFMKAASMQTLFAEQNDNMWDGIFLCVEGLEGSVAELERLDASSRKERLQYCVHEIGYQLFAVRMAVDEFIMWLSVRDYFPENFSVRNAIGDEGYDLIKSVFESVHDPVDQAKNPGIGLLQVLGLSRS